MKFRNIIFENHPILGNCQLDFTNTDGSTVDTIIIAGENGCGKTVLLNELFEYNPATISRTKVGIVKTEIELTEEEILAVNNLPEVQGRFPEGIPTSRIIIIQNFSIKNNWEQIKIYIGKHSISGHIFNSLPNIFKKIYSNVEINFMPNQIRTVTSKNIDQESSLALKSEQNLATDITQLLIDINTLDNGELAYWVKTHIGQVPPQDMVSIRMKRFINAFHSMFETKRFKAVENINGQITVVFEEYGKEMSIDKLSSGEKQIVFRGGFLLKDKKSLEGAYILIDEPEISLHPKWQLKILPFIKKLFTNDSGRQTSQIIVTTHSPFIIHNSNRQNDKVIILQKNTEGNIEVADRPEFYSWGAKEMVKEAFNVNLDFESDRNIVFVEGETDEKYYNKALDVFGYDKSKIQVEWIGRNIAKGKSENTGKKALDNAALFFKSNSFLLRNHIILLYDCDTNKQEEDDGLLHIKMMKKNESNDVYKIGVENLLKLPKDFDKQNFYSQSSKIDEYGAESHISSLDKVKLCNAICARPDVELETIFANIKMEIEKLFTIK
mgnify:CR=1 FL=1